MTQIKVGDIVARKSYGYDLKFKVIGVNKDRSGNSNIIIRGIDYRIEADAPESDLKVVSEDEVERVNRRLDKWIEKSIQNIKTKKDREFLRETRVTFYRSPELFERPGKILHLDGADDFVDKCREHYASLGLDAVVIGVPEKEQPRRVKSLLSEHNPDILVLTGHDGMIKNNIDFSNMSNYKNSINFVNAVKEARSYEKSLDNLVIFAGACQSNYEAILDAGSNFSSSPKRILIHMFDPVTVAEKIANTRIDKILLINDVIEGTDTGFDGIGGLQTRGKSRIGGPKISH